VKHKVNIFLRYTSALLYAVFIHTAGSWGSFIINEEGYITDDWSIEDENMGDL